MGILSKILLLLSASLLLAVLGSLPIPHGKELFYGAANTRITLQDMLWFVCNSAIRLLLMAAITFAVNWIIAAQKLNNAISNTLQLLCIAMLILATEKLYNEFGRPWEWQISEILTLPFVFPVAIFLHHDRKKKKAAK